MYIIYFEDGSVKIIEENLGYCIINNRLYLSTHYDMIYLIVKNTRDFSHGMN